MPKINKEEYKVLRNYYLIGIRWISRNENGNLVISKVKPDKIREKWLPNCPDEDWSELINSHNNLFHFIEWEDSEPYSIAELIKEYEYHNEPVKLVGGFSITQAKFDKYLEEHIKELENKSEEKEMSKDIEWLKEEITEILLTSKKDGTNYFYYRDLKEKIYNSIDQLNEPEVTLDRAFEKVAESYSMTKEEIWRHLEQLEAHSGKDTDEKTEVKNIEWLKEEVSTVLREVFNNHSLDYVKYIEVKGQLERLFGQLDEPETVEVEQTILLLESVLKENKRLGKLLEEKHEEWFELMDEINNQETLTPDWIDDNSVYASFDGVTEEYVHVDDLKELLVPKQEEVKRAQIPEWIIEWYQGANNELSTLEDVFDNLSHDTNYSTTDSEKIRSRIMKYGGYSKMYEALSHIYFGVYEIQEQEYYVLNNDNGVMLVRMMDGKTITEPQTFFKFEDMSEVEKKSHRFTEQEIKDYDPRYWAFRKPVEELEECL